MRCQYLLYAVCLATWSWTNAELFTAISEVEPLLETHKKIIDDLDDYIQKEEKRLYVLKKHLNLYKKEHGMAMEDIPNYLGNPINAFTLIKRLTTDLDFIEKSIKIGTGDVKAALQWTKKLLALEPKHPRARGNVPHFQKTIAETEVKLKRRRRGETGEDDEEEDSKPMSYLSKERKVYEALCRGEIEIPSEMSRRLKCSYLTENHPFLKLAPIKMEQMYIDPDIVVFHQVLSDDEIEHIKDMAKPRFKRAVVHDPKTGELVPAHYRISKSVWLKDEESDVVSRVSRRVADFTGLTMDTAEELQVVNYGIGGHYEPHFDFARKEENAFKKSSGNRIATVLFYMSEVAQGGATVFTELGLSVFPVKNAAVFWLNLHPSGEGDIATRHAACPVLRGSKWVSNKWIHQGGQELLKPCNLEYQQEDVMRKIPRPISRTSR
ncbi:Prolyl 4-hydroxylase subunit alpha-1 [Papilio machaon]|uniref:procollagen-proline 4-dioxygenase n=1 Tax=Papilio machaon TaxID=76193 RepID=A0A194R109_PAPMA|nr:Prolyl 4-hydroxylase subunit alpha-1 [Papilio machaon]